MKRVIAAFARNLVFANILLLGIVFAGVLASMLMIREMFPETSVDVITVTVPFPGADPEEVEEGISRKVEEAIDGLTGIKRYTTLSSENVSTCAVEVLEDADMDDVKERVRNAVDSISNFPEDAEKPVIEEVLFRSEVLFLVLWGGLDERTLKEWGESIKDELQALPEVSQVQLAGAREYEIAIELSEERLREYGLTFRQVANAVRASNLNSPGGTIRTPGEEVRLRVLERKYTGEEFGDIVVMAMPSGEIITLDRIAEINDGFTEDPIVARYNGQNCVLIQVMNTPDEDALDISEAIHAWVERKQKELPAGAQVAVMTDVSNHLRARIRLLVRNGLIGLTLVFLLLWMFLDLRLSFWAAMGIPISLAGALAILWFQGQSVNRISLFGLIMVLGIIVDDAIVVGEAIYVHRKEGDPPLKAAVEGVVEVGIPVIAAVTTTIVAFMPLLYVGGMMGKFIKVLPIAVISCLTISLVECLILLPAHLSHLPDPNRQLAKQGTVRGWAQRFRRRFSDGMERFVEKRYVPLVTLVTRWRYVSVSVAIAVLLLTVGLFQAGLIKYNMFPSIDGDELEADVTFPDGTPIAVTKAAVQDLEDALRRLEARVETKSGEPLVKNTFSLVGSSLPEPGEINIGPQYGAIRAELLPSGERGIHSRKLAIEWEKEVGAIPGAIALTIGGRQHGPPGSSLEIWVLGERMDRLLNAKDDLIAKLKTYDGLFQIQSDYRPGKRELRMKLKPDARTLGLTVADLASQVYAGYYGEEALRLQRGRDDIRVKVRYTAEERSSLSDLEEVRIRTPQGEEVPLLSVADVTFGPGYSTIKRTDGMRRVAVSAEIDSDKANLQELIADLRQNYLTEFYGRYPGIRVAFEGTQKTNQEALSSLFIGFPLALVGIFVIIATVFRSYVQPVVIMITVPFGIIGAVHGHLLMKVFDPEFDVTLMSLFGIVALAGVVVNDAIVLIECVNNMIADGVPFMEALRRGGARRFRAIFLTTVSTVGGLMPMIVETDLQARFLIPMAVSIAAGVAFATLLTLLLIPSLLAIVSDIRLLLHAAVHGRWPTREEVEPARNRKRDPLAEAPEGETVPVVK